MKRKLLSGVLALVLVLSFSLVTAVPVAAADPVVPDRTTAITRTADRLVALQSTGTLGLLAPPDFGWNWVVTGLAEHSANPSEQNMYGPVMLGLLDAYEETSTESYLAAATDMANHMTNNLLGNASEGEFYKRLGEDEHVGAYDYQFLMRYAEVSSDSAYSDYAIALWTWDTANTAMFASPEALNNFLLGWAGPGDPGAAAWQLAAFGTAIHAMGDDTFATGCAALIVDNLGSLAGDHMALAESLEFLSELAPATYSSTIDGIITDLVAAQQADGSWNDGFAGTFQDTAYAVRALAVYGGTDGLDAARKGAAWLIANQLPDGGWIDDTGPDEYSQQDAEGLRALVATVAPVTIDTEGYYTIQQAIDSASPDETISVAPGTYNERVDINKSLTLEGANAGIPGSDTRGPESIINPKWLEIFDGDTGKDFGVIIYGADTIATFDGFTVENYHRVGILAGSYSLNQEEYPNPSVVHILNNIVSEPIGEHNNNCIQVGFGTTGTIIGNEVFGAVLESPDYSGSGILVSCSSNLLVSNNYVHNSEGGIQIMGWPVSGLMGPAEDNIIEYNRAEGNESGIVAQQNAIGTIIRYNDALNNASGIVSVGYIGWADYLPSGTQIHYNNMLGNVNYGVKSYVWDGAADEGEEVDATNNWWGDATGPKHATNPSASGDEVSDNVGYTPWLDAAYPDGTQRSYNVENTDTTETFNSIQAAIDDADTDADDIITVAAGTYNESVLIAKPLTLQGPNVGISPVTGTRVEEAVITGVSPLIQLEDDADVNPLTIEGFTFQDVTDSGVTRQGVILANGISDGWGNVTIHSNRFMNNYAPAVGVWATSGSVNSGWTITDNLIDGVTGTDRSGIYLDLATDLNVATDFSGWEISNNTIRNTEYGGIMVHGAIDMLISGNIIENVQKTGIQSSGIQGNVIITDNVITRAMLAQESPIRAGIRLYGTDLADEYGKSQLIGPVWVTNNTVTDSYIGFAIKDGHDITGKEVHVNYNNFTGNIEAGLRHGGTGLLDATNNWWDTTDPMYIATIMISGVVEVDFDPWLPKWYPTPPTVVTAAASSRRTTSATLNATLDDLGSASEAKVYFEWGTSTAYGNTTELAIASQTGDFSATISGLSPSTTYHFRANAYNHGPDAYGDDVTFTTRAVVVWVPAPAPPVGTTDVRGQVSDAGVFLEPATATSDDELLTLDIPEGTVGLTEELEPLEEITVVIMDEPPAPPEDAHVIGLTYDLGPDGATFDPPITLTFSYDPDALPEGVAEEDLVLAYYDEEAGEWVELVGVVDTENNTITASVPHFTTFAVIGTVPAPALPLPLPPDEEEVPTVVTVVEEEEEEPEVVIPVKPEPAAFSVSYLSVSPRLGVEPGETVAITVLVANTGGESGSYTAVLKIDGLKEAEETVTIAAGEGQDVSFNITREEASSYTVAVDGLSGSFTVVAPPEEEEEEEELPIQPPAFNWPLYGGIIGGVIVVAALGVFFWRRRRAY